MNPRPLDGVLEAVYRQIPDKFPHKQEMREKFDKIIESIPYTAPEAMFLRWEQAVSILADYVTLGTEWERKIRKIINAEVDYLEYLKD